MDSGVVVQSWVRIDAGCEFSTEESDTSVAVIHCGKEPQAFEFVIDADALREFIEFGTETLEKMDALRAQRQAERNRQG